MMPVVQGFAPEDYVNHVSQYGDRLGPGAWVGVGSVCKRNRDVAQIEAVLLAIKAKRPDLQPAWIRPQDHRLRSPMVCALIGTADIMAWSFGARMEGRNANSLDKAAAFTARIAEHATTA